MSSYESQIAAAEKNLSEAGINASHFVTEGGALAQKLSEKEPKLFPSFLQELSEFSFALKAHNLDQWNNFRYGIRPLKHFPGLSPLELRSILTELLGLLTKIQEKDMDYIMSLQQGISLIPKAVEGRPELYLQIIKTAKNITESGEDPHRFLELGAESCLFVAAGDEKQFSSLCQSFEMYIKELSNKGFPFKYPIAVGLHASAKAHSGAFREYLAFLDDSLELIDLLRSHGFSPFGVFEYGMKPAYEASSKAPEYRKLIMESSLFLASHGVSSQKTLQRAFPIAFEVPSEIRYAVMDFISSCCLKGADPSPFFGLWHYLGISSEPVQEEPFNPRRRGRYYDYNQPEPTPEWQTTPDLKKEVEDVEDILTLAKKILVEAKVYKLDTETLFTRVLPGLIKQDILPTPEILLLAWEITRRDQNTGYILDQGFHHSLKNFKKNPDTLRFLIKLAKEELENWISPKSLFYAGSLAAKSICQNNPERLEEVLTTLHQFILELKSETKNPDRIFTHGILNVVEKVPQDPDSFIRLMHYLCEKLQTFRKRGIQVENVLVDLLSVEMNSSNFRTVLEIGTELGDIFSLNKEVFSKTVRDYLPLLARFSNSSTEARSLAEKLNQLLLEEGEIENFQKSLVSLREGMAHSEIDHKGLLEIVHSIQQLGFSRSQNANLVQESLPLVVHPSEKSLHEFLSFLRGQEWNRWSEGERSLFLETILPAALVASKGKSSSVREEMPALKELMQNISGPDHRNLSIIYRLIAERSEDLQSFIRIIKSSNLSMISSPEYVSVPVLELAQSIAQSTSSTEDLIQTLITILKETDKEIFESKLKNDLIRFGLPLLTVVVRGKESGSYLSCFKTLTQIARSQINSRISFILQDLSLLSDFFDQYPTGWRELITPLPSSQGRGSGSMIYFYLYLVRDLSSEKDFEIIRYIVSQKGVKAMDILRNLVQPALRLKVITSLAESGEVIKEFIDDIGINDIATFTQFIAIRNDEQLSPQDKRKKIKELKQEFENLIQSIISGEVSDETESKNSFFNVLLYIFNPAYTMDTYAYEQIYKDFSDYPEHVTGKHPQGIVPEKSYELSEGGYVFKEEGSVNPEAWKFLISAMEKSITLRSEPDLINLGENLFSSWVQNELTQEKRLLLTAQIYTQFLKDHDSLPEDLSNPMNLIKLKNFIEDTAQEIIHSALGECHMANPERFLSHSRNKIIPVKQIGKGLLKAVVKTIEELRSKQIDLTTAETRIRMQLKGFDLSQHRIIQNILAATDASLPDLLSGLKSEVKDVDPGQVYIRVFQDLLGDILSQMKKELFGDGQHPAKVEYQKAANGGTVPVRFQVTKRKAHAPVGFSEGVCTAKDIKLWENPNFMHVIFWGLDNRCYGGFHILLAEEGGKKYLTLPGINPNMHFLSKIKGQEIFEKVIDFAHFLKDEWQLDGIWIPTAKFIHSNRMEIQDAIQKAEYTQRSTEVVEFSYSPYRYTFSEVFEVK